MDHLGRCRGRGHGDRAQASIEDGASERAIRNGSVISRQPPRTSQRGFLTASAGERGYNEDEVDAFLELVEERLLGRNQLTAAVVRDIAFGKPRLGKRGYNEDDVDAFLSRVEATVADMERGDEPRTL